MTKKVIEYAQYLQKNPQSVANLPPLVVIDGQLNDGAHRLSAINLLQKRMDPKNPLWKQVKLKVNFGTSADVASEQGVAESVMRDLDMDFQDQQWDAIVGYVIAGLKKNMDIGTMELNLSTSSLRRGVVRSFLRRTPDANPKWSKSNAGRSGGW